MGSSSPRSRSSGHVLVAVERVVVEIDLGIEADDLAVLGHDQRIDFQQAHVLGDEGVVEALHQRAALLGLRRP